MNNDKVIEAAKSKIYGNSYLSDYEKANLDAFAILLINLVNQEAELLQSQSEPVAKVIHTKGTGLFEGRTITKVMLDVRHTDLPHGTKLFTHPPLSVNEQYEADAERYRHVKKVPGLSNVGIDQAIAQKKAGE